MTDETTTDDSTESPDSDESAPDNASDLVKWAVENDKIILVKRPDEPDE